MHTYKINTHTYMTIYMNLYVCMHIHIHPLLYNKAVSPEDQIYTRIISTCSS